MNTGAIDVRSLEVGYGRKRVLRGLELSVPRGATTVLLGANGEGKTTLIQACLGVLRPSAGQLQLLGMDPIKDRRRLRERIGYVPDRPDAYGWMTALDLFAFLKPHYPSWSFTRARMLADQLDVPLAKRFKHMSRGQGMKAMLAAAMASDPDLLLLDEPFGGLDPLVREEVLRNVINALGENPRTVLLTTHDLDVAARVADRVAVLSDGRVSREGPAAEIAGGESATPEGLRDALAAAVNGG